MKRPLLSVILAFVLLGALIALMFRPQPTASPTNTAPVLKIEDVRSPGGLTAWLVEDHSLPILSISFAFSGAGSVNDPADKQGLARLVSNTLDEGAGPYKAKAFQETLENNAITLSYTAGRDDFYGTLKTLDSTQKTATQLLALSLTSPHFEAEALSRMVEGNIARIKGDMIDPNWMAARLMNDRAYAGSPYAQNSGGTLSTLPHITPDDLKTFHRTYLTRARLKISVVGNITAKDLGPLLDRVFGDLPLGAPAPNPEHITLKNQGKTFLLPQKMPQTLFSLMMPAPQRGDKDEIAVEVMNHILGGGGFGSRLMETIREKAGLTYGIYSNINQMDRISTLGINASTRSDQYPRMHALLEQEIMHMKDKGITETELKEAKGYLLGSMPLQLTSTDRIASLLLSLQMDGRPIGYLDTYRSDITALKINDINRVAKTWLNISNAVTVLVGNPAGIKGAETVTTLPNIE